MSIPHELIDLVDRFDRNKEDYKSSGYNETQIRREFIDPLFILMGWDVNNKNGYGEAYKDVIHEDSIKIGGEVKAPDYCFRIGGTRKFFLEAKKPFVNIKQDIGPAFQLRRYGWSAKLPVSILTDFEEFAVYDCRIKPQKNDKSSVARIMYFTYDQYVNNWEELNGIFSKDAVLKGSFDRFVESKKQKKGTMGVDDEFLLEIESWRDVLARNLAVRNPNLTTRDLNFAVHRIIDRFIFLRICEDRGIENYGRLRGLLNGDRVYPRLCQFFTEADDRYNSGLFHFNTERGRDEVPDNLTLTLNIDDKIFKDIIRSTYYPDSPYEFSVLPADILGQIYEQFLGKVIRLTEGHQAKVEEKPDVRKAGGVYYTPTFIVDYIVKNTLGELVKDKTPQQVSKLKILDPACGSGSFLIGAYQFLLDWHRDWYFQNNPEKHQKEIYKVGLNDWRLTTKERKRILLNNIFGVDIDSQAVEVTKLSLLLKVLEGENEQSINKQLELFHERALPDLGNNIKCGNSLIGPDFYDQQEFLFLSEEEKYRINVFDWNKEFENIMSNGGFDAIIGNPPYIPIETMFDYERNYYQHLVNSLERKYDSSVIFIAVLAQKVAKNGFLGFISSLTWWTGENYSLLRKFLLEKIGFLKFIDLPFNVFKNAYVDTGIYILTKKSVKEYSIYRFKKKDKIDNLDNIRFVSIPIDSISAPDYKIVLNSLAKQIITRCASDNKFVPLGRISISTQGLTGSKYKKYDVKNGDEYFEYLEKGQVYRYCQEIKTIKYVNMETHKSLIKYYLGVPKILIRRLVNRQDRIMATYTTDTMVFTKDINPFLITDKRHDTKCILGILNSKLISYLYVNSSSIATKDDFRQTTLAELRNIPIPQNSDDKRCDSIVQLVDNMLELNNKLHRFTTPHELNTIKRLMKITDEQIDMLVYELYGLTEEEINIVENQ